MKSGKMLLLTLFSVALVFSLVLPASVLGTPVDVRLPDDRSVTHSMVNSSKFDSAIVLNTPAGNVTPMVAASAFHMVGLQSDGTVVAVGPGISPLNVGQCDVGCWQDIIHVAAGWSYRGTRS